MLYSEVVQEKKKEYLYKGFVRAFNCFEEEEADNEEKKLAGGKKKALQKLSSGFRAHCRILKSS